MRNVLYASKSLHCILFGINQCAILLYFLSACFDFKYCNWFVSLVVLLLVMLFVAYLLLYRYPMEFARLRYPTVYGTPGNRVIVVLGSGRTFDSEDRFFYPLVALECVTLLFVDSESIEIQIDAIKSIDCWDCTGEYFVVY